MSDAKALHPNATPNKPHTDTGSAWKRRPPNLYQLAAITKQFTSTKAPTRNVRATRNPLPNTTAATTVPMIQWSPRALIRFWGTVSLMPW